MQEQEETSLDALMARLSVGDRAVFSEVFRRLWPMTLRLCTSLLHHDADAADAAQQAIVKILERASEYDTKRPALPWALAIATWECRTLSRWRSRRHETGPEAANQVDDSKEDELVNRDLARAALTALGELSDLDRETLEATFWEEAHAGTGATFRKRRERALGRLRDTFRRLYGID